MQRIYFPLACMTISGPQKNYPCLFPFGWLGEVYTQCTNVSNQQYDDAPWCATHVDSNGNVDGTQWGNCGEWCPGAGKDRGVTRIYFEIVIQM